MDAGLTSVRSVLAIVTLWAAIALVSLSSSAQTMEERCNSDAPTGLPLGYLGQDHPLSADEVAVGRRLFFDDRLSGSGDVSCSSCHMPQDGFAGREQRSKGAFGRPERFSPTIINVGYNHVFLWDGIASSVEDQVARALESPVEMGSPLAQHPGGKTIKIDGRELFFDQVVRHLARYVRSVRSFGSRFDDFLFRGERSALSSDELAGFDVFRNKGRCVVCHTMQHRLSHSFGGKYALFTDNRFHNLGAHLLQPNGAELEDLGRFRVTQDRELVRAFKTPTLRDVALRKRFMHNGALATLEDVVQFYDDGGRANPNLDPLIEPLHLSTQERDSLVAFLKTLTGQCRTQ